MEKVLKRLIKKIDKFNADLKAYEKVAGDTELPYIDCTVSGYDTAMPYSYKVENGWVNVTDCDGNLYEFQENDDITIEEVKEALKYDSRRLNKAWRIWKSDNPDAELEKDEE